MEERIQQLPERFNVRVYGLLENHKEEILISREIIQGMRVTKFPGGGLEFGEGIEQALKREFWEETSLEIEVGKLFYVNDFLQVSAFNPKDQLLAIYYRIYTKENQSNKVPESMENGMSFEWIPIQNLHLSKLSFPVDKVVGKLLQEDKLTSQ